MIKHVVCYKFKKEVRKNLPEAVALLKGMQGRVPEVVNVQAHADELGSERSFDLILEVWLESFAALERYQADGYHAGVIKPYMHSKYEKSVSIDFTLEE